MSRTLIAATAPVAILAGMFTSAAAADESPGLPTCAALEQVGCSTTVTNTQVGDDFCQQVGTEPMRCEAYWPFRNPTTLPDLAEHDPNAFPADYFALRWTVYQGDQMIQILGAQLDHRGDRIDQQAHRINRLHNRLDRMRARLRAHG